MNKRFKIVLSILAVVFLLLIALYFTRLSAGKNCCEQPLVRWKFAIYYGECWQGEGGDGCSFSKIQGSGWKEYIGLKEIKCPCK